MSDIEITAKQYKDLKITYSEKNNIDNVSGNEYKITGTQVVNLNIQPDDFIDHEGAINIGYYQHDDNQSDYHVYPFATINSVSIPDGTIKPNLSYKVLGGDYKNSILRVEEFSISGTLTAQTTTSIQDLNSISASATLTYDNYYKKSDRQSIVDSYVYANAPAFEAIREPQYKTNQSELTRDTALEYSPAMVKQRHWLNYIFGADITPYGTGLPEPNLDFSEHYGYASLITKPSIAFSAPRVTQGNSQTVVEFDYRVSIWSAHNVVDIVDSWLFGNTFSDESFLDVVSKIQFTVQANAVNSVATNFGYNNGTIYKEYKCEDNTLMQYTQGQQTSTRQSYITSQNILQNTAINRMVVSFDLLDCTPTVPEETDDMIYKLTKDTVVDPTKDYYVYNKDTGRFVLADPDFNTNTFYYEYSNAIVGRYLKSGDLIKIKDQNDHYIGQYYNQQGELVTPDFEVVTYHGRWDGTFHIEMICKQAIPEEDEEEE